MTKYPPLGNDGSVPATIYYDDGMGPPTGKYWPDSGLGAKLGAFP
jgi:hypothetical protein